MNRSVKRNENLRNVTNFVAARANQGWGGKTTRYIQKKETYCV